MHGGMRLGLTASVSPTQLVAVAPCTKNGVSLEGHSMFSSRRLQSKFSSRRLQSKRIERINASSSSDQQQPSSYRVSLFDAMKVFGPAPERINCRLAMIMFIPMVMREMETSETILQQFANPDYGLVALALLTVYASMIPILKGAKDEDFGFMKVSVEKVNGRLAMLAWVVIMGLEHYVGDVCFF